MTIIVRRDAADPKKWVVIEDDGNGTVTIGGPFETRAYARQVAEGAQIMADRLAAKRTGAVAALKQIAEEAALAPMEDVLGAGVLARRALQEVGSRA